MNKLFRVAILTLYVSAGLTNCSTVVQKPVVATMPSYDGNIDDSGIVSVVKDAENKTLGFVVTPGFVERYNSLIDWYGHRFTPPLKHDVGVIQNTGKNMLIDNQHMICYLDMQGWKRQGKPKDSLLDKVGL